VVEVTAPGRTVYIARQTAIDASRKFTEGFRAQATQVFENLKVALAAAGAGFEHVVKINSYLTNTTES
jgi:enamine deaminase RidA (YjgF/YER057c/UK114 family)